MRSAYRILVGKPKEREHLSDLSIDRIILKCIFEIGCECVLNSCDSGQGPLLGFMKMMMNLWFHKKLIKNDYTSYDCIFLCSVLKRYIPGKARTRPYYLEVALRLPARSTTEIYIEFDYVFLKWQEYPPDANHGFYIGAAIITALLPVGRNYTGLPQDGSTISSRYGFINSDKNFQEAKIF